MSQRSDLELAIQLARVTARLVRKLRKYSGRQDFSLTEQATMSLLEQHRQMLPSELAEAHHISAQAVSQIINRLHRDQCIKKSPDRVDRRRTYISLSAKGRRLLEDIRKQRGIWLSGAIAELLTQEEKKMLPEATRIIEKLASTMA